MSLAQYYNALRNAIEQQDGNRVRALFRLDSDAAGLVMQYAQQGRELPAGDAANRFKDPWSGIVVAYLQTLVLSHKGENVAAVKEFREKHARPLVDALRGADGVWVVPVVVGMASTLKQLSEVADDEQEKKGVKGNGLTSAGILLQAVFSGTAAARGQDKELKQRAAVAVACVMMKIYFKLNTINNCKNVVSTIDQVLNIFDTALPAHRVTFRYYTGRLAAYDEDFERADEHLSYAFNHCHKDALNNKRRILRFLIPIKMLLGVMPSPAMLQRYSLTEFVDIATAVRTGNLALMGNTMAAQQARLVQAGTFLLLEKLQLSVYRRLFKRVAIAHAERHPAKAFQVPLGLFQQALEMQGERAEEMYLICVLANLIYRKYIKGYLAYKSRVLVLAKTDAFPPLSGVTLVDPFSL